MCGLVRFQRVPAEPVLSGLVKRRGEARGGPGPSQAGTREGVRHGQSPSGLLRTPELPRGRWESDGLPGATGGLGPGNAQSWGRGREPAERLQPA